MGPDDHAPPPASEGTLARLARQLSKLAPGGPICHLKLRAAFGPPTLGLERSSSEAGLDLNDSFPEPAEHAMMSREPSITFGGGGGGRRRAPSRTATHRAVSFCQTLAGEASQGDGLSASPSQYLARTVIDEGSQADFEPPQPPQPPPPPERDIARLLASAQQAELGLLSARLKQKEEELAAALNQAQRAHQAAAEREAGLASRLEEARAETTAAQQRVAELQAAAEVAAAASRCDAGLEAQLGEARHRVAELEAQVAVLEHALTGARERVQQLEQLSARVVGLVQGAIQLPGEGGEGQGANEVEGLPLEDGVAAVQRLVAEHAAIQERFLVESKLRRELHNQLQDLKGAIRVYCRVRPLSEKEEAAGRSSACKCDPLSGSVEVAAGRVGVIDMCGRPSTELRVLRFSFDQVYGPGSTQEQIFRDVSGVVSSVLDGYNACIFAYGQTGSGKTFTMEGTPEDRAINYRAMQELFGLVARRSVEAQFTVALSVMEVYMEQVRCLLGGQDRLEVKLGPTGGLHMPGLQEVEVSTADQAWELLRKASAARHAAETQMNVHSSRSHCLLCLRVEGRSRLTSDAWSSRLWLIDLAGSERVSKTEATGERLKEAQFINKSLSALGDCIYALASKSGHVPFRNSKLTFLLQESLAGAGKTLMVVNVNPTEEDAPETCCSLSFASRVWGVELGAARKNVAPSPGASSAVAELKALAAALQEQVATLEAEKDDLSQQLDGRGQQLQQLQAQLAGGGQLPSGHHQSGSATVLGSRFAEEHRQGGAAGVGSARPRMARSLSAPEPELGAEGSADPWLAPGEREQLLDPRAAWQQVPLPLGSPQVEGAGAAGTRASAGTAEPPTSAGGIGQRCGAKTPIPRLQLGPAKEGASGRVTPKTTPRAASPDLLGLHKKARSGSPGASGYASDASGSGRDSARSAEGSRSAPSSAGRVMRPAASPGGSSGTIKSYRPETGKPTARGCWT